MTKLRVLQTTPYDLDNIDVAAPCPASWADMVGGDRVRFCGSCQKNVFNLSGMTRAEAIDLLQATEGKACVRFYRRSDGTILTQDCPVGIALVVKRAKRASRAAAALAIGAVATLLGVIALGATRKASCALQEVRDELVEDDIVDDVEVPSSEPGDSSESSAPPSTRLPEELGEPVQGKIDVVTPPKVVPKPPHTKHTMGKPISPRMGLVAPVVPDVER